MRLFRYLGQGYQALSFFMKSSRLILNLPSPIQELKLPGKSDNLQIYLKRDDLIHPEISGNKWRKLKYNIRHAISNGYSGIISVGGPFSNHLFALATACKYHGLQAAAIVRGDQFDVNNPTLRHLITCGVKIHMVSRSEYTKGLQSGEITKILSGFPGYWYVPEGGSNEQALPGIRELMQETRSQLKNIPDYIICACGTGMSIAGLTKFSESSTRCLAVDILKIKDRAGDILKWVESREMEKLTILDGFHFGGFAKYNFKLVRFVNEMFLNYGIPLDMIYTGKMLFGFFHMLAEGYFQDGSSILILHTGGLQGNAGFNYLHPDLLDPSLVLREPKDNSDVPAQVHFSGFPSEIDRNRSGK